MLRRRPRRLARDVTTAFIPISAHIGSCPGPDRQAAGQLPRRHPSHQSWRGSSVNTRRPVRSYPTPQRVGENSGRPPMSSMLREAWKRSLGPQPKAANSLRRGRPSGQSLRKSITKRGLSAPKPKRLARSPTTSIATAPECAMTNTSPTVGRLAWPGRRSQQEPD